MCSGIYFSGLLIEMEVMSLEEDDYEAMFITQSDKVLNQEDVGISQESGKSDEFEFGLNIQSEEVLPVYSDISDVDDFEIQSSQVNPEEKR